MSETLLNILISSVTGVFASAIVWWFVTIVLVPKLKFAQKITKIKTTENLSGYRYRFKFENTGNRNIIDLEIIVRVTIKGVRTQFPTNNEIVYLPTSSLDYKKVAIVRPIKKKNKRPVLDIKPHECDYFTRSFFPPEIQEKAKNHTLTLDDILGITDETNVQIIILGYDSFSGVRKYFESPHYTKEDIVIGYYDINGLEVIPIDVSNEKDTLELTDEQ